MDGNECCRAVIFGKGKFWNRAAIPKNLRSLEFHVEGV